MVVLELAGGGRVFLVLARASEVLAVWFHGHAVNLCVLVESFLVLS